MRTENSIRNISVSFTGQLISSIMSFITRTVFVYTLTAEYLGMNGLFSDILNMLSLAELGIGGAIIFSMYEPIAKNDESVLKQLLNFYGRVYRMVGIIIGVCGLFLAPFLSFFIKDMPDIPNLTIIYILYLTNTVTSYFYAYKCSVLDANQKQYIGNLYRYKYLVLRNIVQMAILVFTHNFILYLLLQVFCSIYTNWKISKKTEELYPWIKKIDRKNDCLTPDLKHEIQKNVYAMFNHNLGSVVVNGTDHMLISKFAGLASVGLYSNYYLILNNIVYMVCKVSGAVTASVGNLGVLESREKIHSVYRSLNLVNFWIYSFCTICLWVLFNPFITVWVGKEYLLSEPVVLIICANFYISGMRQVNLTFRDAMGLFWYDRYKPIAESAINLITSIYLAQRVGMAGVFIGTLISTMVTSFWVEPYIIYKYKMRRKVREYMACYAIYTCCMLGTGWIVTFLTEKADVEGLSGVILRFILCVGIVNGIYLLLFFHTSEFKYVWSMVSAVLKKLMRKKM